MGIESLRIKINFKRFELFVVVVGRAPLTKDESRA